MENESIIVDENFTINGDKTTNFVPAVNLETCEINGEELLSQLDQLPELILPYLQKFLCSEDRITQLSNFLPQVVEFLVNYSQIDDEISYTSKIILVKIFKFNFQNPSPLQIQLANFYFSLSHNEHTIHEFINLTYALIDQSIVFKDFLFSHEGIDIISEFPYTSFQDDIALDFLKLISLLIRHDAPVTDDQYSALVLIFQKIMCQSDESEFLDIVGKTFYYISKFMPKCLIETNILSFVSEVMTNMTDKGICFVLVGLSICFTKENNELISRFAEIMNPEFFLSFIDSEFENIVIDGTVAITNMMRCSSEFFNQIISSGGIDLFLNNMKRSFDCKRVSARAIFLFLEKQTAADIAQFVTGEFIELLNELMETEDKEALSVVADYVQLFQMHNLDDAEVYIEEFVDIFLCDHADDIDDEMDFI